MGKGESNHSANQNKRRWLRGVDASHMRRCLVVALGSRVRLGRKAKMGWALAIFLIAFSVRALVAVDFSPVTQTSGQLAWTMSIVFHNEAIQIVRGHGVLIRNYWDPTDTSLLIHPPGYSIYLATIYALFGENYFTVQLVQDAVTSLAAVLIFLIAGRLITWPVGIVSGLIVGVWHHFGWYSNVVLPDSICVLPLLEAVYVLIVTEHGKRRAWWAYGLAGVLFGLSVWLRANTLAIGPFVAIALPFISSRPRRTARRSWLIAVVSLLVVAPITIRNYVLYHEFIPVSINTGIVMWEGIADVGGERFGAVKTDPGVIAQEAVLYDDPRYGAMWSWPDGIQRDRDRIKKSLRIIAQNPFWFARGMVSRVGTMFKYTAEAPLAFRASDIGFKELGETVRQTDRWKKNGPPEPPPIQELSRIPVVGYGESISWARPLVRMLQRAAKETSLLFILAGLAVVFFVSPRRALYVLLVPLYYFVFQSGLHTEFRYTIPLHHFMFVFSAAIWVLIGSVVWAFVRRVASLIRRATPEPAPAA
jgi:hypothetical protein